MDKVFQAVVAQMRAANSRPYYTAGLSVEVRLTELEKLYLQSVERGDVQRVKRLIENLRKVASSTSASSGTRKPHSVLNINCTDPIGRSALLIAIDNENVDMVRVLLDAGVELGDAILHAIEEDNVVVVDMLLQAEDKRRRAKEANKASDDKSSKSSVRQTYTSSSYSADMTPLMLAAQRNSYEIVKLLLDRGETIPRPHDIKCSCTDCRSRAREDSLTHSLYKLNAYKALTSPALMALSSRDPILTAFELSVELWRLSTVEIEHKDNYDELANKCEQFAVGLLEQTRSSRELHILLNYDAEWTAEAAQNASAAFANGEDARGIMKLARLRLAIKSNQKKFVVHPNCQQLLATLWFDCLPGFRRYSPMVQAALVCCIGAAYPILSLLYIALPPSMWLSQFMRRPFVKLISHIASYLCFVVLVILASQPIPSFTSFHQLQDRGLLPSIAEWIILAFVIGQTWDTIKRCWLLGLIQFNADMWNMVDLVLSVMYLAAYALKFGSYFQVKIEIRDNNPYANATRPEWDQFDPALIGEAVYASASIFTILKVVQFFTISSQVGPLQLCLGSMVSDVVRFMALAILVCFAFSCGINQLYSYYKTSEYDQCQKDCNRTSTCDECNRSLLNLFEVIQSLYFACYGLTSISEFQLQVPHSFTQFMGKLMFGVYCGCMIIILINMFIAILTLAYETISDNADTEWKFARSKLWISYFQDGGTVPPPFNVIPTPKTAWHVLRWVFHKLVRCSTKVKQSRWLSVRNQLKKISRRDIQYQRVINQLVKRYVAATKRQEDHRAVTADDVAEVKHDIRSLRYELLDILSANGMKLPSHVTNRSERKVVGYQRQSLSSVSRLLQQMLVTGNYRNGEVAASNTTEAVVESDSNHVTRDSQSKSKTESASQPPLSSLSPKNGKSMGKHVSFSDITTDIKEVTLSESKMNGSATAEELGNNNEGFNYEEILAAAMEAGFVDEMDDGDDPSSRDADTGSAFKGINRRYSRKRLSSRRRKLGIGFKPTSGQQPVDSGEQVSDVIDVRDDKSPIE